MNKNTKILINFMNNKYNNYISNYHIVASYLDRKFQDFLYCENTEEINYFKIKAKENIILIFEKNIQNKI